MRTLTGLQSPHHIQYVPDKVPFDFPFLKKDEFDVPTCSFVVGRRKVDFFSNGHFLFHTSNKEGAMDVANAIRFSQLLLNRRKDVPIEVVRLDELFRVNDLGSGKLEYDMTDPAAFPIEVTDWDKMNLLVGSHHRVSTSKIEVICELADEIYYSPMREQILLFFGCYSDRQHHSHNVSFMQAWTCVELTLRLIIYSTT